MSELPDEVVDFQMRQMRGLPAREPKAQPTELTREGNPALYAAIAKSYGERDWKEGWIDQMGLIVALSGEERFEKLRQFKEDMARYLSVWGQGELKEALRQRFTPTNGQEGCQEATEAVKEVVG